jgi:hypothetical protein
MPYGDHPNNLCLDAVKETIWRHDHLSVREIWKLRDQSSRFRIPTQSAKNAFGFESQLSGCSWIFPLDVSQGRQELKTT